MTTEQCQYDTIIGTINNIEVANMGRQDRRRMIYCTGKWKLRKTVCRLCIMSDLVPALQTLMLY